MSRGLYEAQITMVVRPAPQIQSWKAKTVDSTAIFPDCGTSEWSDCGLANLQKKAAKTCQFSLRFFGIRIQSDLYFHRRLPDILVAVFIVKPPSIQFVNSLAIVRSQILIELCQ